jgi:hypothetical protein
MGDIGSRGVKCFIEYVNDKSELLDDIVMEWNETDIMDDFVEEDAVELVRFCYRIGNARQKKIMVTDNPFEINNRADPAFYHDITYMDKTNKNLWMSPWTEFKKKLFGRNYGLTCRGRDIEDFIQSEMREHIENLTTRLDNKFNAFVNGSSPGSEFFFLRGNTWFSERFMIWCIFYQFLSDLGLVKKQKRYDTVIKGCRSGFFMILPLRSRCLIIRPPVKFDINEDDRLHCENGPAVIFDDTDNGSLFFLHGISFDKKLYYDITDDKLSGKEILGIANVEQRMAAIKHLGYGSILESVKAKVKNVYKGKSRITGEPVKYELLEFTMENTPFRVVRVEDHTTHHTVTLGVPIQRSTETCLGAIAWTFGMTEEEYKPFLES